MADADEIQVVQDDNPLPRIPDTPQTSKKPTKRPREEHDPKDPKNLVDLDQEGVPIPPQLPPGVVIPYPDQDTYFKWFSKAHVPGTRGKTKKYQCTCQVKKDDGLTCLKVIQQTGAGTTALKGHLTTQHAPIGRFMARFMAYKDAMRKVHNCNIFR
jgi:hypothetical protein